MPLCLIEYLARSQPFAEKVVSFAIWVDSSSFMSNILAAGFIAWIVFRYISKPKLSFELTIHSKKGSKAFRADIGIVNDNHFLTHEAEDIFVQIFLPADLLKEEIVFYQNKPSGPPWKEVKMPEDPEDVKILGKDYLCLKMVAHNRLFPLRTIHFIKMNGSKRSRKKSFKIYYKLSTRYGMVPKKVSLQEIMEGILPSVTLAIPSNGKGAIDPEIIRSSSILV